jgi:hypothetical protein
MKKLFYIIAICSVFISCSKKDEPEPTPTPSSSSITINSTPQFTITLDGGSPVAMITDGISIEGTNGSDNFIVAWPDSSSGTYSSSISNSITGIGLTISHGGLRFIGNPPSDSLFLNFYPVGPYPYTISAWNGVKIDYSDGTGTYWSTDYGTALQPGSSFIINDRTGMQYFGDYHVVFKATFNCILYDGLGNSKTLTNGIYVSSFAKI